MAKIDLGRVVGKSAYEIAVDNGFEGTEQEWLDSMNYDELIPPQASSTNQLADKDFVNSSIATATAEFIGTFNSLAELQATTKTYDNNDYAFVIGKDSDGNTEYSRYKWNGSEWIFEYTLNNSSFTSEQWKAINSNVTDEWRQSVNTSISNKVDKVSGKGLSTNDFTTAEKNKLAGLSNYDDTELQNELNKLKTIYVGEIYNSSSYYKIDIIGNYARPIEFVIKTSNGGYDRFIFGQSVTTKRVRLGNTFNSLVKYIAPTSNGTNGTLLIKSSKSDIAVTVFYTSNYSKRNCVIETSTEDEWNSGTDFTLTNYALKTDLNDLAVSGHTHDDRYYTETEIDTKWNNPLPWRQNYLSTGYSETLHYRKIGTGSLNYTDNTNWSFYSEIDLLFHYSGNVFERGTILISLRGRGSAINFKSVKFKSISGNFVNLAKTKINYKIDTTNKKINLEILTYCYGNYTNILFRNSLTRISDMLYTQSDFWTWGANGTYVQSSSTMQSDITSGYTEIPLSVISVDKDGNDIRTTYATKAELEEIKKKNDELEAIIEEQNIYIGTLENNNEDLLTRIDNLQRENSMLNVDITTLQNNNRDLQTENLNLQSQITSLNIEIQNLNSYIRQLEDQIRWG